VTSIDDLARAEQASEPAGGTGSTIEDLRAWARRAAPPNEADGRPAPAPPPEPAEDVLEVPIDPLPSEEASAVAPDPVRNLTPPQGPGLSATRRRVARVALWARNLGALLLLFVAYQLWGTGFEQARNQTSLEHAFGALQPGGRQLPLADGPMSPVGPPPLPGAAAVRIEIPAIGIDQFVVEGTAVEDLKKGPGHYTGSPLPGQPGNAAIAGHRTTYGAPFNRLDEIKPGDEIITTTRQGRFLYVVETKPAAQSPRSIKAVNEQGDDRLTLTTCNPKYSAAQRLIVVGKLRKGDGSAAVPASAPAAPPASRPGPAAVADAGGGWHVGALPGSILLAATLAGLCLLSGRLELFWPRLSVLAVTGPIGLTVLLLLFERLNLLLPSNV